MRRTKAEAEETREQIFRAGIKVFAEKGYTATRMCDVAREAGCSRGAIYWHFENKEAFFVETTNRLEGFYGELIAAAKVAESDAVSIITSTIKSVILRFVEDPEFRAMQELVARNLFGQGDTFNDMRQPIDRNKELAIDLIGGAIKSGQIYAGWSAETAHRAISGFVAGILMTLLDSKSPPDEEEIDELAAFLGRAIAPRDAQRTDQKPVGSSQGEN